LAERAGDTREIVAEKVGMKRTNWEKTGRVVDAIDRHTQSGDTQAAEALRKVLNEQSVDAAHQMTQMTLDELQTTSQAVLTQDVPASRIIGKVKRARVLQSLAEMEFPTGKYRVLYADPPWQYGDAGVIGDDNYGRAERHYPTMTLEQICALDVEGIALSDAVLFLWTTSPMLEDAFAVIRAWGFSYKTSFVWDKVAHNFGHYNSVRHEMLLVCTRGSCTPDNPRLFDSVVSVERSSEHSEKPEVFRQMIDELYPHGPRIELFSRREIGDWTAWGNQTVYMNTES